MIKAVSKWWVGRDKKAMQEQLLLSQPVLDRLIEMLEESIEQELKALTSEKGFEYDSYNERIISKLGEIRALRRVVNLIKVEVQPNG